jgi:hypothetical protein
MVRKLLLFILCLFIAGDSYALAPSSIISQENYWERLLEKDTLLEENLFSNPVQRKERIKYKLQKQSKFKGVHDKVEFLIKSLSSNPNLEEQEEIDNFLKVMDEFNFSWDYLRDFCVYRIGSKKPKTTRKKKQQERDFEILMGLLKKYRKKIVEKVITDVISKKYRGENITVESSEPDEAKGEFLVFNIKSDKESKKVSVSSWGSDDITSDFDFTFQVNSTMDGCKTEVFFDEVDLVKCFNNEFREKYVVESGYFLDVNAYARGFLSEIAKEDFSGCSEQKLNRYYLRLTFSFLAMRQVMSVQEWKQYKDDLRDTFKSKAEKQQTLDVILNKTEELYEETKDRISQRLHLLRDSDSFIADRQPKLLEMYVRNNLYEESLLKCAGLVKKYNELKKQYLDLIKQEKVDLIEAQKVKTKIVDIVIEWEKEQGIALVFANEAYYNIGAILHHMGQLGLKHSQLLQALLMNMGYAIKHIKLEQELGNKSLQDVSEEGESSDETEGPSTSIVFPEKAKSVKGALLGVAEIDEMLDALSMNKKRDKQITQGKFSLVAAKYIGRVSNVFSQSISLGINKAQGEICSLFRFYLGLYRKKKASSSANSSSYGSVVGSVFGKEARSVADISEDGGASSVLSDIALDVGSGARLFSVEESIKMLKKESINFIVDTINKDEEINSIVEQSVVQSSQA